MPTRSLSARSFFDAEFACPNCLTEGSLPWLLAQCRSRWCPTWLFAQWHGSGRRGRDAWPAVVLLTLWLLRWSEDGMSRRAAVRRAETDIAWRAAMGLAIGGPTPSEKTMRNFERFLRCCHGNTQVPRYMLLHEHIVRACLDCGVVDMARATFAMDSTPMWCYGAVRDTVRLLGDGLRMLASEWGRATRQPLVAVAETWQMPFLLGKSTKGAFAVDWRDETASAAVVTQLAESVIKATTLVRRHVESVRAGLRKRLLRRCRHLLRVVSADLESDAEGKLTVAQRVAADRLVSITDPEARHGRKSKSQTFNGYKVHLLGDVLSGLLMAVAVTCGNEHDGAPAHRLVRRAKNLCREIEQVLGDTAYGGARLRHLVKRSLGVELLAPPPPVVDKVGSVGKRTVVLDFEARKATCANQAVTKDFRFVWSSEHGMHVPLVRWSNDDCRACPLRAACCGKEKGGRRMLLHPYERELRAARERWSQAGTRARYRIRTQCERLVNQMTRYGGRQARAFGLGAAQAQAHAIAAAVNLRLLARALAMSASRQQGALAA